MSSYRRGRRFEYRVRDHLEKREYYVVRQTRSAFPDLIAIKKGEILLVECKVHRRRLTKDQRQRLLELTQRLGAKPMLAYREGRKLILEELKP